MGVGGREQTGRREFAPGGWRRRALFALFLLSGACSLLYQVVWLRLAFAAFGVVTPVLSIVVSVFMAGLLVGTWYAGGWAERWQRRTGRSALWLYAVAELAIAVGAFAVPALLERGAELLLPVGQGDSTAYLATSALILAAVLFPWCVAMGATLPLGMAYARERSASERDSFSFLYLANVLGAMAGTLVTSVALVELFGFVGTLRVAAVANLALAAGAAALVARERRTPFEASSGSAPIRAESARGAGRRWIAAVLFGTGATSMAAEVVWTRAFTPVLGTVVYSFAAILFVYLLATWLGSAAYRRAARAGSALGGPQLAALLAVAALLPLVFADPRLGWGAAGALAGIAPFCALLGYLTPKLVDELAGGDPRLAGRAYAVNVLGCAVGPLVASYVLLPWLGVKGALLVVAAPYGAACLRAVSRRELARGSGWLTATGVGVLAVSVSLAETSEDRVGGFTGVGEVRRDHTATVISFGEGRRKQILVNGVGMTHLTTITKVMSHWPLLHLDRAPRNGLVVCFGMGTSWRSMASWGIEATAVELIPSVRDAFPYYFDDAAALVARPNLRIVIDDGRRFLRRNPDRYDVIVLDPPPPITAAGSSLLYSREFYELARTRLTPGGILQQWFPAIEGETLRAVAASLGDVFPHVRVYLSHEGWGYHFLASERPLPTLTAAEAMGRLPPAAAVDLGEWIGVERVPLLLARLGARERDLAGLRAGTPDRITDDRPFNEYFLLRRLAPFVARIAG